MMKQTLQTGFSAVELLITLFIGFLFVVMGYQLYTVAVQLGGETREEARASEFAYDQLRLIEASSSLPLSCSGTSSNTIDGGTATMYTTMSCPMPSVISNLRLVVVRVKYNVSQKEVSHAMYIVR